MLLKIDKINGADEMLSKIARAEELIRELRDIANELRFDGLKAEAMAVEEKDTRSN